MNIHLSPRENQILQLISQELTTSEIAQNIFVSPETVRTHRRHLHAKLGVRNVAGLIRVAFELGFLMPRS